MILYLKGALILLVIILAEIGNGIFRMKVLAPRFKDFRSRQISVLTGCLNISVITLLSRSWLDAQSESELVRVGLLWFFLMLGFEVSFGRLYMRMPWHKIFQDFQLWRGRLLPLGMLFLAMAPWLAARFFPL